MQTDPISDLLALIDPHMVVTSGLVAEGGWSVRCPAPDGLKFVAMLEGTAWVASPEFPDLSLGSGDILLLNGSQPFVLADDLSLTPRNASEVFTDTEGGVGRIGARIDARMIGGHIDLDRDRGHLLLAALPPAIKLGRERSAASGVRAMIGRIDDEARRGRIGGGGAIGQLARLIILDVLREYFESEAEGSYGWLRGLADPRVGATIVQMHERPDHGWQLDEMARLSGMSRTSFAQHFKAVTGFSPMAYLTSWRMHLAEQRLARGARVAQVAHALGYASEAAFSQAFKRERGMPPSMIAGSAADRGRRDPAVINARVNQGAMALT